MFTTLVIGTAILRPVIGYRLEMPHYRGPLDGPRVITSKNIGKDVTKPVRNSKPVKLFGVKEKARAERWRQKVKS